MTLPRKGTPVSDRHMMRHAKRDDEAGGPGLGVLGTRKRTRRTDNGSIITRSPKRQSRRQSAMAVSSSSIPVPSQDRDNVGIELDDHLPDGAPVSPPGSASDPPSIAIDEIDPLLAPIMPCGPFEPYVEPVPGQFDAADGSWSLGLDGTVESFSMDTATNFNMPFAASHNYNWLFDVRSLDDDLNPLDPPLDSEMVTFDNIVTLERGPRDASHESSQLFGDGSSVLLQAASFVERGTQEGCSQLMDLPPTMAVPVPDLVGTGWMNRPAILDSNPQPPLPRLEDDARLRILTLVAQAQPVGVDGHPIALDSPLLSLSALQGYCDLFFTRFNTIYPLIHQPTFDANTVDTVFLVAILTMGATYSSWEAHQLAVGIHNALRNQLFCHADFSPHPDLWILQAMLLIDCFGKMRAGHKQRERAQLFHCVLIKLIRRSNCCTIGTPTRTLSLRPGDLSESWRQAMDAEQRKRLAMYCFIWDTQHAALFSQSLCMSAFEIRSSLPCSSAVWQASTPEDWAQYMVREPDYSFLSVLKGYITPGSVALPRDLNAIARIVILHGLMSVSADLKRRDQTILRSETPEKMGTWIPRMCRSYDLWKVDFDADCLAMKLNQTADQRQFTGSKTAGDVLYHAAHISLNVEVLDLQITAGATHILGRPVNSYDRERSRRNVLGWLHGGRGAAPVAARHASSLLQDAVLSLHDWEQTDAFHFPWCLYLATLTCWAFHRGMDHEVKDKTTIDLSSLIVTMTTCSSMSELTALSGKYETKALVMAMAQQLATVRWEVVRDAMKVLVKLSK
ncbi:hypothetical protein EYZ11_005302 [Aspergillus tanneri]|uniref:Xylanolytic transcriptional activator regulatory domain-containing protein n=1 Tax=Aspergillus tanneri TaxID=1220188 RepID=A0A4S3JIY0_9EURO|nr:hypothetical protein EYZ11_005302 [Aspergillus tanneri]